MVKMGIVYQRVMRGVFRRLEMRYIGLLRSKCRAAVEQLNDQKSPIDLSRGATLRELLVGLISMRAYLSYRR